MKLISQYRGLRREIYILFFGKMVTSLGSMIWPVMTMILSQKLGFSAAEISYYFVGASVIMLPANVIGGRFADRFNKKRLIVVCDSISIVCFFISAVIPLGIGTVALFVLAGIFQSMESPAYEALFADYDIVYKVLSFQIEYVTRAMKEPIRLWQEGWGVCQFTDGEIEII